MRVDLYLDQIENGRLDPASDPEPLEEAPSVFVMDAKRNFGQWSAYLTIKKAIEKAETCGIAAGGITNSGHVGRLAGEWVTMAADAGYIGLAFCNGGGRRRHCGAVRRQRTAHEHQSPGRRPFRWRAGTPS